ncbi:MAG TPA: alpha/beta hydrolase [Acidothermaceae bacterium]
MTIDSLEAIEVGGATQWIRIKGADVSNPVLLLIQQGPGLPMINETRRFTQVLDLEEAFTVVYWDQRGCGRSLRGRRSGSEISVDAMVDDTVAVLELLRDRFGEKTYVAGFSFGATVGAYAAVRRPVLVSALVAIGMDVDGVSAGNEPYDFALRTARARGNRRAIRQLERTPRSLPRTYSSFGWARATGPDGATAETWLETGESYAFTAAASIRAVEETLARSPHGALKSGHRVRR